MLRLLVGPAASCQRALLRQRLLSYWARQYFMPRDLFDARIGAKQTIFEIFKCPTDHTPSSDIWSFQNCIGMCSTSSAKRTAALHGSTACYVRMNTQMESLRKDTFQIACDSVMAIKQDWTHATPFRPSNICIVMASANPHLHEKDANRIWVFFLLIL